MLGANIDASSDGARFESLHGQLGYSSGKIEIGFVFVMDF
jgi:hypothetical protein